MADRVKQFETARAQESINTDLRVEAKRPEYIARVGELLENPSERNEGILENLTLQAIEEDAIEDGVIESGEITQLGQYWGEVAEMAELPFSTLHTVPVADRGSKFSDARSLMVLWAKRQAFVEIFAIDEAVTSTESGEELKRAATQFTPAELKNLSDGMIDIKAEKERLRAEQSNGA